MAEGPRRRLRLVIILMVGFVFVLVVRLVHVQIVRHGFYTTWREGLIDQLAIRRTNPPRGVIRDRDGYLMAGNAVLYSVEAAPSYMLGDEIEDVALQLGSLLHLPAAHIELLLTQRDERGELPQWVPIASPISKALGEQIAEQDLSGVTVVPLWTREYPESALAAHIIGFCNAEGEGFYGVEGFYDSLLRPEPVVWQGPVDAANERIPWTLAPVVARQSGTDLTLTLDRTVQAIAEEELARAVWAYQATGGTVIVMDPRTFEVLALASWPTYSPGKYTDFFEQTPVPFEDPAVSWQYEPGSVFKVLTVAAALDVDIATPETTYYDQGRIEVGGQVIQNASHTAYGERTVTDMLAKSLNVGAAWLSVQMGPDTFYRYLHTFGIGQPTGIDLANEVSGQLWLPSDVEHWHDSNLGTNAFGQGVAVTPMQMIAAVATIANDGARLRPHVVSQRIAADGSAVTFQPVVEAQVISPQTARQVTEMMVQVVEDEMNDAGVPGYRIAGKTGTAQIPVPGGYDKHDTIVSFVGFGPVPNPEVIILVKLDRPQTSTWAADTAVPAFQRLARRLFVVLDIPPEGVAVAEAR